MDWQAASAELRKKLDPSKVKPPAPGKYGEYVEAVTIIEEANRIFGHDGWSYRILHLAETCRFTCEITKNGQKQDQTRVGYICTVEVEVGGVVRQDVGHGQGQGKPDALGDHVDSACKEAVTDALKRALRTFGWPLGLALYDKSKAHVGVNEPTPDEVEERRLKAAKTLLDGSQSKEGFQIALEKIFWTYPDHRPETVEQQMAEAAERLGLTLSAEVVQTRARIADKQSKGQAA